MAQGQAGPAGPRPADVLGIFGITGDLATRMTLPSLYRLERRGLLTCPVVGVAFDDWTDDRLRDHAREAIAAAGETLDEAVFGRLAGAPLVRPGRLRRRGDLPAGGRGPGRRARAGLLPGDPALAVRHRRRRPRRRRPDARRARGRGEALRPRPRIGADPRRRAARAPGRVPDLPHRPLPREDGVRGDPLPAAANAMLEPLWNRNYIDCVQITMAETVGVEDRAHFYDPLGALCDVVVNHLMQVVAVDRHGAPGGQRRGRAEDRGSHRPPRRRARPTLRTTCAASTRATARSTGSPPTRPPRPTPRCASRSTTGAGGASPSSSEPASGCRRR